MLSFGRRTSVFNSAATIERTIRRVLEQTCQDFELILLNHASTDGSRDIARSYEDPRIKHIDLAENMGAGGGLLIREMVRATSGKYLKLFCADDELLPDGLQTLVDYLEQNPEKGFAFGNVRYVDGQGKFTGGTFFEGRAGFVGTNDESDCLRKFYHGVSFLPYIGNIIRRDLFDEVMCDSTLIMLADVNLWMSLILAGVKIGFVDLCVANYRVHDGQMSAVAASKRVMVRSHYEVFALRQQMIRRFGARWVRQVVPDSPYADKVESDVDAAFVLAEDLLRREGDEAAYLELNAMLQDNEMRQRLHDVFGFTIAEFRRLYSSAYVKDDSLKGCVHRIWQILSAALSNLPAWARSKIARLTRRTMEHAPEKDVNHWWYGLLWEVDARLAAAASRGGR